MNWILLLSLGFLFLKPNPPQLEIVITGMLSEEGFVQVLLFDNPKGFPDQPEMAMRSFTVPIQKSDQGLEARLSAENLPAGKYAVSVFHDHNGDGKMRKGPFGIPKDKYGFSNNVFGLMGPPSFDKAAFEMGKEDRRITIVLRG